jgi:hypothetical protein
MVMPQYFYNTAIKIALLSIGLCSFNPGMAAETPSEPPSGIAPLNIKAVYEFGFTGVRFGKLGVEIEQDAEHYRITSDIITTGLVKIFVKHSSHTTVEGKGKDFIYPDISYQTHYQTKKKKKSAMLVYKDGKVAKESVTPPENRATRPEVEDALKSGSSDPLSLIMRIREALFKAQRAKKDTFSVTYYDARRLTRINFSIIGPKTIMFDRKKTPVIMVDASRKLVAGFTASELASANPNEPPLHIYFSNDERLLPLKLEAQLWMGMVHATLTKECGAQESCLFGNKD